MDKKEVQAWIRKAKLEKWDGLDLSRNRIPILPPDIGELENLTVLDISHTGLVEVPPEVGSLKKLRILKIAENQLTKLPIEIGQLTELITLDISNNRLTYLPSEFGNLSSLQHLQLNLNKLTYLPDEFARLSNLHTLNLNNTEFSGFPLVVTKIPNLQHLSLSIVPIKSLPIEIGQLIKLQSLELMGNAIDYLPSEMGKLVNLKTLDLGGNSFNNLPHEFSQLSNLEILILGNLVTPGGELTEFPVEITKLKSLQKLDLNGNKLKTLPNEIGHLQKLTSLEINENMLTDLPAEIGQLGNLKVLELRSNQIASLPAEISNLKNLQTLDLRRNPLPIPPEILEKVHEPKSIINYLSEVDLKFDHNRILLQVKEAQQQGIRKEEVLHITPAKPLNQIKLLIVGQGSVGKTSLVQQILHGTFNQNQTKTEGISINQWQVDNRPSTVDHETSSIVNGQSSANPSPIKLNIWDFGGQEIMHATHQFFLTKRSLYLLVLDARLTQEENRVEYWLKIIQSFGGESPVLIVGNKTDQHPLDIDRTGLQKKYPNIVGILETSAATGAGIDALKTEIAKRVVTLPHVRDLLPETWFTVKSKLEELGRDKNFITQDEYLGLCGANDVTDETSQHTLIGFLHDLGIVLHFQDDPRLEALGILNPQWVTNGVYKILNSKELFQNQGVLTLSLLNNILNLPEYPRGEKRMYIVDMMKKFELCYDIEPDKEFLIPDLLPKDEPDGIEVKSVAAFQYLYPVLPSSVITRFVVRMSKYIENNIAWRTGVVLKIGNNRAIVKADIEDKMISIYIDGVEHTRRDALSAIRYQLDEIHDTIKGLNPQKRVPIPEVPNAEPLEYDYLLQLERDGFEEHPVKDGNRLVKINVRKLLSGIESEAQRKETGGNVTNIYVGGNFDGNLTIGDGNQSIKDSYNKIAAAKIDPELMQTLKQLADAVSTMTKDIPKEQVAEITDDLGKLVDEAIKPKPNKRWYSVSIDGLTKAAENLDKLGEPVINLSKKVLSLLTGGVIS